MRILVTGLDGFTGRYLKLELEAHAHTVIGLSCDLTNPVAVAKEVAEVDPEVVIHLAAVAFVGHANANAFYEVNLIGTRNLLVALEENVSSLRSVLLVSSANVYGNSSEGRLSEHVILNPANDYAVSKLAMERMAYLWLDRLPLFVVRPFNYTGVGQAESFLIPKIVAHFQTKQPVIELGNLEVWRDISDVRMVAEIYRKLIELGPVGETFNVCSGRTHSLYEVLMMCEKIKGYHLEVKVNPMFVRENEVRVLCGDNNALKKAVGDWHQYEFEETLRWMMGSHLS